MIEEMLFPTIGAIFLVWFIWHLITKDKIIFLYELELELSKNRLTNQEKKEIQEIIKTYLKNRNDR